MPQAATSNHGWHHDLQKLGYNEPLPAPIPGIQATLAMMTPAEIHNYIQETDTAAMQAAGEDGEPSLLLTVLDLSQWSRIFEFANSDLPAAMARLKELHTALLDILAQDEADLEASKKNSAVVEVAIRHANKQTADDSVTLSQTAIPESGTFSHPFLNNLSIEDAHRAALEDFQESILTSQIEKEQEFLVASGCFLAIPFVPHRTIEDQVSMKSHRVWATGNVNSLAPILISTWRIWAGMSQAEIEECRNCALNNKQLIANGQNLANCFSLYSYDHAKCPVTTVKLHIKTDIPTANDRREKHPQEMWNVYRPYLRCACHPKSTTGCTGSVIWWDHACWYMVNHLEKFFPDENFPTLKAKLMAFMIWMQGAGRTAIRCQIAFTYTRTWMCNGAIQFAANPMGKILPELPELPGPKKIERLLKPASFSVANPGTPSSAPPTKKQRINLNTPPQHARQNGGAVRGRGRGSYGRGRGNAGPHNSNQYRRYNAPAQVSSPFQYFTAGATTPRSERLPVFSESWAGSVNSGSNNTGRPSSAVIQEVQHSPIKRRVLSFTDEEV